MDIEVDLCRLLERESSLGLETVYLEGLSNSENWLLSAGQKRRGLQRQVVAVETCEKCGLCRVRARTVFGEGDLNAELMLIGEAPGQEEDRQGRPFVGACGKLLDKMLAAIGLQRQSVYICNVVKCRPPDNRTPLPEEMEACFPYLARQIEIIAPRLICLLGKAALQAVCGESGLMKARGRTLEYGGIPAIPTFHPGYLLRNVSEKRQAWEDMKRVANLLGLSVG